MNRLVKIVVILLLIVFFYFVARVEFYLWNSEGFNQQGLENLLWAFVHGLRFDVAAASMVVAPFFLFSLAPWPQKWLPFWQWFTWLGLCLLQLPLLIVNLVDTEFINFTGRRLSFEGLFILQEVPGKFWNFAVSYWPLFLINTVLVALLAFLLYKVIFWQRRSLRKQEVRSSILISIFFGFIVFVGLVIGIRGGLQKKPLTFVHANVFAAPILNNLVLNSTFTLVKSWGQESLPRYKYFADREQMLALTNARVVGPSLLAETRPQTNVVVIILEGFGREYIGVNEAGKSYTPFLDQLETKSLSFIHGFASGRRSIEGVAAILSGIPAMMEEPFISSNFTSNYFVGLGSQLKQQGYHTSFFHGGNNGTMYFDTFAASAGIDHYFGANEHPHAVDHDGVWGIWDEPFLQWMVGRLGDFSQPFFSTVFTLSSHQPFHVPAKYKDRFVEGPIPILKSIEYADYALSEFFKAAEKMPWYSNTLFVITADHTSLHYRPQFDNEKGSYQIPVMFYHPQIQTWSELIDRDQVVSQIDILPSVLDFLGIAPLEQILLGASVFRNGDRVSSAFINSRYVMFAKDQWLEKVGYEVRFFDMQTLKPAPASSRQEELKLRLEAATQYFSEGMWDNKLYYPNQK